MASRERSIVAWALVVLGAGRLGADTVIMKDGGNIPECRIIEEKAGTVFLRTPGGSMGVPKAAIAKIEKGKSVFDTYDAMRGKVRSTDGAGLFKLAEWCRLTSGMRPEATELLEKVIEILPDHPDARRLLGYTKVDGEWRLPPPLLVLLKVPAPKPGGDAKKAAEKAPDAAELKEKVYGQLAIFADARKDVIVVDDLAGAKPIDGCELSAGLVFGGHGGTTFYGQKVLGPKTSVVATFTARASWLKKPLAVIANGEVDSGVAEPRDKALMDAMMRNCKGVHALFDELTKRRVQQIEAAAAPKTKPEEAQGGPKDAGAKKPAAKKPAQK